MSQRRPRQFSIKGKFEERQKENEEHRIHFRQLRHTPRKLARPIWWLFILSAIILLIYIYLKRIG